MVGSNWGVVAGLTALLCGGLACGTSTVETKTEKGPLGPIEAPAPVNKTEKDFLEAYNEVAEQAKSMSRADFDRKYAPSARVGKLSYDPSDADNLGAIVDKYKLSAEQEALFKENGFVVMDSHATTTFEAAYGMIYAGHLPVVVTTDSMLYALHRSYDSILKQLEVTTLKPELAKMLHKMHRHLGTMLSQGRIPSNQLEAARDVDLYLSVCRSLLGESSVTMVMPSENSQRLQQILAHAKALQPRDLEIFGVRGKYDYSQLKPRGHYTESEDLTKYFQAMMWIGRTEMPMVTYPPEGGPVFHRQAFDAAYLVSRLRDDSGATEHWDRIDMVVTRMVGEKDSMDPGDMSAFAKASGLSDFSALSGKQDSGLMKELLASPFGKQRIQSQIIKSDPWEPKLRLPRVFLLMGQRFVLDSYIFHNVSYDRVIDPRTGDKVRRMLPSPLDAQFALGSNAAGEILGSEFEKYPYEPVLHEMRTLVDSYPADFWEGNLYNGWLGSIRALNDERHRDRMPESLRTKAWDHKKLNTQLASWAELRHDTLLYAKQSYSASISCEFPEAYVEPYPLFYRRMAGLAGLGEQMAMDLHKAGFGVQNMGTWFARMKQIMGTLEGIAVKQLTGESLTGDEENFLKATIEMEMVGCGERQYDGWYGELFFNQVDVDNFKPIIADVHTSPTDAEGNEVGWVLHAGTGFVRMMLLTVNHGDTSHAYIGPVSTYHEKLTGNFKRMDNNAWMGEITQRKAEVPDWTRSFSR